MQKAFMARRQSIVHAVEERGMEFHHFIKQVILGNVQHFGFDFELGPASGSITGG